MYHALYRKYRSQTFNEIIGQDLIATTLKQAVSSKKVSHAYLFSGPRGTGKTSLAKIFAKAMNCPNQVNGEPCNHCEMCHDINNGSLEDVIEIDAASNNGVDEIREIREKSTYATSRATFKVYIIDEVHMLSTGAFNALLKTLEEPSENVVFILATTELHKIPATILSRVQRFEFKTITSSAIQEHLSSILDKEGISYDVAALSLIAHCAEGGMRDALSILDQALSLVTDNHVSLDISEEITGSISLTSLHDYVTNINSQNVSAALSNLEIIFENGKNMARFATDLLNYLRDLLIVHIGDNAATTVQLPQESLTINTNHIFKMIDVVTDSLPEIRNGIHPKIYAEVMTIQLCELPQDVSSTLPEAIRVQLEGLQKEVEELKNQVDNLTTSNIPFNKTTVHKSETSFKFQVDRVKILSIMEETVADSQQSREYLESLKGAWNEILDSISAQDRALLLGSEPVLANSENAILAFDAAFNAEQATKRADLNAMFSNIMSKAAGFSPDILAVPRKEFNDIRTEFAQKLKHQKQEDQPEKKEATFIPEGFDFLSSKIKMVED
jgi:DNA polymerase-3 subunit gamma/tau